MKNLIGIENLESEYQEIITDLLLDCCFSKHLIDYFLNEVIDLRKKILDNFKNVRGKKRIPISGERKAQLDKLLRLFQLTDSLLDFLQKLSQKIKLKDYSGILLNLN